MIIWGGSAGGSTYANDGARYSPTNNTWAPVPTTSAPAGRAGHTAIWSGTEMIVWGGNVGGSSTEMNTGGRYNPTTNTWIATTTTGAPAARASHSAVWTGSNMIVWGGGGWNTSRYNSGYQYNPSADTWTAISTTGAPTPRGYHTAVWTGSKMIIWGGEESYHQATPPNLGGVYDLGTNTWTATLSGPLAGRISHAAAWTGSAMLVWGGSNGDQSAYYNDGAIYNMTSNTWTSMTISGAPSPRSVNTSVFCPTVWTGMKMLTFGGSNGATYFNSTFSYAVPTTFMMYQKP